MKIMTKHANENNYPTGCIPLPETPTYKVVEPFTDNNGEWVKWEDIKPLIELAENLVDYFYILNGNPNAIKPKGILNCFKENQNDITR